MTYSPPGRAGSRMATLWARRASAWMTAREVRGSRSSSELKTTATVVSAQARVPASWWARRAERGGQAARHVVNAGPPGASPLVDAEGALLGGAGGEDRVEVAHEQQALGAAAGLLADQVIAEALLGHAGDAEAEQIEPLGQDMRPTRLTSITSSVPLSWFTSRARNSICSSRQPSSRSKSARMAAW